ncbi:hypothetical protein RQP46_007854 [Phenoliferia psychrophenolica]
MRTTAAHESALIPQAELSKQLRSLEIVLAPASPSEARARLRAVCEWAVDHGTDITIDVLNTVPGGSVGVPILKVVLGIALLRRTSKWLIGFKKDATVDLVNGLTTKIEVLQSNYVMPALRRIAADVKPIKDGAVPLNTPHPPAPAAPASYGRNDVVASVVRLLTTPNSRGVTEHVVLVGVGGIGKTTLSQEIVHHPDLTDLGAPDFIRCQRVSSLPDFQQELLRLRKEAFRDSEILEDAVRNELLTKPRFLVLDNLFDSPSAVPPGFRSYLSTLANIPNVTFLITTRNSDLSITTSTRRIQRVNITGLADGPAEELFRLHELLRLLDGIPPAIKVVAARARSEPSLRDVVKLWTDGQAWSSGTLVPDREDSLAVSLALSFKDESLISSDTISLLCILADLPLPHGENVEVVRLLEPVRQYIRWRQFQRDADSPVILSLALHQLMTPLYMASGKRYLEVVESLLQAGAVLDTQTDDGLSALHFAAWQDILSKPF